MVVPAQHELIEVNERLNAAPNESAAGRTLSALLQFVTEAGGLPRWFLALERREFNTSRSKAVRFTIAQANPALSSLVAELEPMSQIKRDQHIKQLIGQACEQHKRGVLTGSETALPSIALPAIPLTGMEPLKPLAPETEEQALDPASLKKRFKNNLNSFL